MGGAGGRQHTWLGAWAGCTSEARGSAAADAAAAAASSAVPCRLPGVPRTCTPVSRTPAPLSKPWEGCNPDFKQDILPQGEHHCAHPLLREDYNACTLQLWSAHPS